MGKVKSAIITALLVTAIIVLALAATVSFTVPGTNGVKRYNSFLSNISLGGDLTGNATAILYPSGVLSDSDYNYVVSDTEEANEEKKTEYEEKYVKKGNLWVDKELLGNDEGAAFAASILSDAEVLSDRLSEKGYTSYSVSVVDGYALRVTVPTGFTYAEYKQYDNNGRSEALTAISHTLTYLSLEGGVSLRSDETYKDNNMLYFSPEDKYEMNKFIKNAELYGVAGNYALRINLTDNGFESFNKILTSASDSTAYLFVGETCLQLTFNMGEELTEKSLYFQADTGSSQDYAIVLDSVAHGKMLANKYNDSSESSATTLIAVTPSFGENAAVFFAVLVGLLLLAAIVCSIVKYKLLGLVNTLMILAYAVSAVTAIMLLNIQLTLVGVFTLALGLAVMCFSNFFTFESVRKETALGRTIGASIKTGYQKTMWAVLDVHVMLVLASFFMWICGSGWLLGAGDLAAAGLIFLVASIGSYVLYWLTRFMWYVISSPVRNKFDFCGFESREDDDDE